MKKVLFILILCISFALPTFAAKQPTPTQLNQQGWSYLKKQDYTNAVKNFTGIYQYAKTQQDYGYIIKGLLGIIKDDNAPASLRIKLCNILDNDEDFKSKITDEKLNNIIETMKFKKVNIIAKTDEKDEIFNQSSKSEMLQKYHNIFAAIVEQTNGSYNSLLYFACFEYSIGNQFLGMRLFEYVGNEKLRNPQIAKLNGDNQDLTELINLVMELCN